MNSKELIEKINKKEEFITFEDGFVYYWATGQGGFSSWQLRVIADELDKRNKSWQENISKYFEENEDQNGGSSLRSAD